MLYKSLVQSFESDDSDDSDGRRSEPATFAAAPKGIGSLGNT
jgi:hypothetical protein